MTDEALIHLRVPAATKGRWIRASRAAGMRLTDWIVQAVEAHNMQQLVRYVIPDDVSFADLKMARESDGSVSFDWTPIERICEASGISVDTLRNSHEDHVTTLMVAWYAQHLQRGGAPDPVQEDLIAEAAAEERIGQTVSLAPGRA